jgi:hypothetical protein
VSYADFGLDVNWADSVVGQVLTKHSKLTFLEGKKLLQEAYDQAFGIFDYVKQYHSELNSVKAGLKRPLASVALHEPEESSRTSSLFAVMRRYADLKVGERYKLSLTDFLEMPREYVDFIFKDCERALNKATAVTEGVIASLQESANKK